MTEKFWYKVARVIIKAGRMPFPVSDTLIELLQTLMTEEQAKFILNFKKPSLNMDQLKEITGLDDEEIINEKLKFKQQNYRVKFENKNDFYIIKFTYYVNLHFHFKY